MADRYTIKAVVKKFPGKGGWFYVPVPQIYTEMSRDMADRGLVPITVNLGESKWDTSLLPMGDGTHFIALNAKVRKTNSISEGSKVSLGFMFRL